MELAFLGLAVGLVFASSVSVASSVSGSHVSSVSDDLKNNFKFDVDTDSYDCFFSIGCLFSVSDGCLYSYYYENDTDLATYISSDSHVKAFERGDCSFSVKTLDLSFSVVSDSSSGFVDHFATYGLKTVSEKNHFVKAKVEGFDSSSFHSFGLNRWVVSSFSGLLQGYDGDSIVDDDFDICASSETLYDSSSGKLLSDYSKKVVITDKIVKFAWNTANDSGDIHIRYYCAFNTSLDLANVVKVRLSYKTQLLTGATSFSIPINWTKPYPLVTWEAGFSNSDLMKPFVDVGPGSISSKFGDGASIGLVSDTKFKDIDPGNKTFSYHYFSDYFHFFDTHYTYSSIVKPSLDSTTEWSAEAKKYSWAFWFYDNCFTGVPTSVNTPGLFDSGGDTTSTINIKGSLFAKGLDSSSGFVDIKGVRILTLWNKESTGIVEYSSIDKPTDSSGADMDTKTISEKSWWDKFCDWFMKNLPMSAVYCGLGLILAPTILVLLVQFFPQFIKFLFGLVKFLFKLLLLPFRLIVSLFHKSK